MCGIAGIIGEAPSRETVEAMTRTLVHRGPDDSGMWEGDGVCLGHTRLSILDLSSAGHQPMTKGHLTVVYNGEIYNFQELRRDLELRDQARPPRCEISAPRIAATLALVPAYSA